MIRLTWSWGHGDSLGIILFMIFLISLYDGDSKTVCGVSSFSIQVDNWNFLLEFQQKTFLKDVSHASY